jgi:hypothetical protein
LEAMRPLPSGSACPLLAQLLLHLLDALQEPSDLLHLLILVPGLTGPLPHGFPELLLQLPQLSLQPCLQAFIFSELELDV